MGDFRKTGTEAVRGKPHTRCSKIQPIVANTKRCGEASGCPFESRKEEES